MGTHPAARALAHRARGVQSFSTVLSTGLVEDLALGNWCIGRRG